MGNLLILVAVVGFVVRNPQSAQTVKQSPLVFAEDLGPASPVDQLSSADIAVHVARMAALEEATAVTNQADTVNAQLAVAPADDNVVAKPQIITTTLKTRKDIQQYITVPGDTVSSLANKFGVTSDTIRWSNDLTGDALRPGTQLWISPVNGIVYLVKHGDTVDALAARYRANQDQIIAFNDIEISGLPIGEYIVIPDGVKVGNAPRAFSAGFSFGGNVPIYGGNGYDRGYCTWWAAVRRAQVGKPIPSNWGNARTWLVLAQRSRYATGSEPQTHAIIWTPPRDYYGHVGFVEAINPDGSVNVSEMNTVGWNKVSYKTLTREQALRYMYIY